MKKPTHPLNIRIVEGVGDEAGFWVVTIDQAPAYRFVAENYRSAIRATCDYADAVRRFGPNPHPLLIQYNKEPSLPNWLACRQLGLRPPLPSRGGSKWLGHSTEVLEKHGISEADFIALLDADEDVISKVSLRLLNSLAHAEQLKQQGQTHLARRGAVVPFEIIDWLIHCMLDGLEWNGVEEVPYNLKALLRFRLVPGELKLDAIRLRKENQFRAAREGGRQFAMGRTPSFRLVAAELDVEPSTVKRWFESVDDFIVRARTFKTLFHPTGEPKSLFSEGLFRDD